MGSNGQPTTQELEECRAKLVYLLKGAEELGYSESREFRTSKIALMAIEEQIKELGARSAKKRRRPITHPMKRA